MILGNLDPGVAERLERSAAVQPRWCDEAIDRAAGHSFDQCSAIWMASVRSVAAGWSCSCSRPAGTRRVNIP